MGKEILERFRHIDILVNNAGFGLYDKVQDQSIEEIESITFTNYLGMIYCTKTFLDSMISRKSGHIVNVASVAAGFGVAGLAAYCASKYAILGFSEALHHELHGTGVGITVVSPIGVKTNFSAMNHLVIVFQIIRDLCSSQKVCQKPFLLLQTLLDLK
jgi:uncharacterized protein